MDTPGDKLIAVVIPTRNRAQELLRLLDALCSQTFPLSKIDVFVIDSSDIASKLSLRKFYGFRKFRYLHTEMRSSAVQRNIGIDLVSKNCKFLFFLDDDVIPPKDYLDRLIECFKDPKIVGVSGIALESPEAETPERSAFISSYKRVFGLESSRQGSVLKSGISIPVKMNSMGAHESEWLIGCAAWRYSAIGRVRFEWDFKGYSLGEDVLFSIKMSRRGRLVTLPSVILRHPKSSNGRPSQKHFWKYWMVYRWRVCQAQDLNFISRAFYYWWATLGQIGILFFLRVRNGKSTKGSLIGLFRGGLEVLGLIK